MNPLYSIGDDANKHTNPSKAVNSDQPKTSVFESTLDLSRACFKTQAFGQYEPFEVIDVVAKDIIPLATSHNVRSLPTNAPQLNPLKLNKDFFFVPMQAILPRTWEYIFRQPSQGDDVPSDASCLFSFSFVNIWFSNLKAKFGSSSSPAATTAYLYMLLGLEQILSRGSLVNMLGKTFDRDFDGFMDKVFSSLDFSLDYVNPNGDHISYTTASNGDPNSRIISKNRLLDLIRTYPERVIDIYFVNSGATSDNSSILSQLLQDAVKDGLFEETVFDKSPLDTTDPDDLSTVTSQHDIRRILSYQVACAQFYTRGNIDSIYNAQLWRDNLFALMRSIDTTLKPSFMTINGIFLEYDICSYRYFSAVTTRLSQMFPSSGTAASSISAYNGFLFLQYLFGLRNCLIFGDYFTDSRTQPLATDDYNLPEANISVFDVNKSLVLQRFRNTVVKLKNSFTDYLRSVFNSMPSPDYHFPKYIRGYEATISGNEVAGTAPENNGHLVQNFVTGGSDEVVEVEIDMPGVIIGISYFNIPPLYMNFQERFWLHQNRHDDYNPMLQYLGDQKIYSLELNRSLNNGLADSFAYNSRYAEYKQRFGIVSGSVGTSRLPGWVFVLDDKDDPVRKDIVHLDSQFVRFLPSDYDQMFPTLTGLSLASRFHFIVMYNNQCVSSRNMLVNPQTLL